MSVSADFAKIITDASNQAPSSAFGAYALAIASIENSDTIMGVVSALMNLQSVVAEASTTIADEWLKGTLQADQTTISTDAAKLKNASGDDLTKWQGQLQADTAKFQADNTAYNTQTTVRNSYTDSLAQFTQSTNDISSNDLQLVQDGPGSVFQNMSRLI
jgi:acetyl/propionyl-CoA carboxylase alpha subunit